MDKQIPTLLLAVLCCAGAAAADLKVLTTGAFKPVVSALVPAFEQRTGHKVQVVNDTAGAVQKRVEGGEPFDVLVLTPGALQALERANVVAAGTPTPVARVAIGAAVKSGAAAPDVSTVDKFRQALLDARKVAYIDPASGGSSGIYLDGLFHRLGVADAVRAKAVLVPGGLVAERVVRGEADLALHQVSEILAVPGVTLVGLLPEQVQNYTTYAAAVSSRTPQAEAARALLDVLAGPEAAAVLRERGMLPAR